MVSTPYGRSACARPTMIAMVDGMSCSGWSMMPIVLKKELIAPSRFSTTHQPYVRTMTLASNGASDTAINRFRHLLVVRTRK